MAKEYIEREAVSKYIDVDVFIKSFREVLLGLKAQVDPDLTPKAYAYLRGGEAIIEDLTKFPAADVVEVVRCRECLCYTPVDDNIGECVFLNGKHQYVVPDGYCHLAELKKRC